MPLPLSDQKQYPGLEIVILNQQELSLQVKVAIEQLSELNRTVRGNNGTIGLVTQVALLTEAVKRLEDKSNNSGNDGPFLCDTPACPLKMAEKEAKKQGVQFVSWQWVVDKFTVPIVVALAMYLLFTVIPRISNMPLP